MSFNAIRENKILVKISEFTVHVLFDWLAGIYAKGTYLGCFRDVPEARDVGNHLRYFKDDNTPERCIEFCINGGKIFIVFFA